MIKSFRRHFRQILVLGAVLMAWSVRAQDTNLYTGTNWALLDTKRCWRRRRTSRSPNIPIATTPRWMNAACGCITPDGTAEAQDENFVKVLTEKGKRNNRTLQMGFQTAV